MGKCRNLKIVWFGKEVTLLMKINLHYGFCAFKRWIKEWMRTLRLWRWILVNQKEVKEHN
jgi:hypothetical protein